MDRRLEKAKVDDHLRRLHLLHSGKRTSALSSPTANDGGGTSLLIIIVHRSSPNDLIRAEVPPATLPRPLPSPFPFPCLFPPPSPLLFLCGLPRACARAFAPLGLAIDMDEDSCRTQCASALRCSCESGWVLLEGGKEGTGRSEWSGVKSGQVKPMREQCA